MTPIRCRWHDAGAVGVPPATPGKQAAAAFALYGLRLQTEEFRRARSRQSSLSPTATATSSASLTWTLATPGS